MRTVMQTVVAVGILGMLQLAMAQDAKDDPFERGQTMFKAKKYGLAVHSLSGFVKASVGDSRLDAAKEMLQKAWGNHCDQLLEAGSYTEGAKEYAAFVAFLGNDAGAVQTKALDRLKLLFDNAVRKGKHDQALSIANAQTQAFPNAPALADKDAVLEMEIQSLATLTRTSAAVEIAFQRYRLLREHGATLKQLAQHRIDSQRVTTAYVDALRKRGWYAAAISVLRQAAKDAELEIEQQKWQTQLHDVLLERAAALTAFGNYAMMAQGAAACQAIELTEAGKRRLGKIEAALEKHRQGGRNQPNTLKFADPIADAGIWSDDGRGWRGDGRTQVGSKRPTAKGTVQIKPGFVLEGGTIFIEEGTVEALGTQDKPIILRKVVISVDLGGQFKAQNVVFEDCTFEKGGPWFSFYSSKWVLTDCLLIRSGFRHLTPRNYGLQISRCTFIDSTVPSRLPEAKEEDNFVRIYDSYTGKWSQLEQCVFMSCRIAPSATWMMKDCLVTQCSITGSDTYRNDKNLTVPLCVFDFEDRISADVRTGSESELQGTVRFVSSEKIPVLEMKHLWALVSENDKTK